LVLTTQEPGNLTGHTTSRGTADGVVRLLVSGRYARAASVDRPSAT
jgi:hypothetical protein